MKNKLVLFLGVLALLSFRSDNNPKDYLNVKTPIEFDGKNYNLAWSQKSGNYYVQEYLPDGDSLPDFKEMISVFVLNEDVPVDAAVEIKIKELEEVKKTDPVCNYALTRSTTDQTILIDFVRGESEGDFSTIVEFNLYRYKQIKIGKNKHAILLFAYSKRAYRSDITPFLKSLVEERFEFIRKIFGVEMPEITLAK